MKRHLILQETFTQGGYYWFKSPVDGGADFLVLNTNVYYVMNKAIDRMLHPEDPLGQFAFLENHLADARKRGGMVNIVAHIPPGGACHSAMNWPSIPCCF